MPTQVMKRKLLKVFLDQATKLGVNEHIEEISVPVQNIVEVKRGVRVNTERKIYPGYILIKMSLNDDTWHIIKTTPKLSGFWVIKVSQFRLVMLKQNEYLNKLLMV